MGKKRTSDAHTSNSYPYTAQNSYLYILHALQPLFRILVLNIATIIFKFLWQELTPNFGLDIFHFFNILFFFWSLHKIRTSEII